ncbi:hypothetical protein [Micromonospora ureilytica]|uniref:hypothetical protein n=1 Tax=Micromonospora ureilytica TaxID=709868 RepID=UPI000F5E32CA|nr:hypothetical protein [Micromonospora ureilytica]
MISSATIKRVSRATTNSTTAISISPVTFTSIGNATATGQASSRDCLLYRVAMAEPGWVTLIAGIGGIVLGSVLQWAQAADQARRERRRERESWSREDRRDWAKHRQRLYLDATTSARRQLNSYVHTIAPILDPEAPEAVPVDYDPSRVWRRSQEVLSEWGRLLTEVEFYGSDDVREALNSLDVRLRILEIAPFNDAADSPFIKAEEGYGEAVAQMRRDLGLSEGRKAQPRSSFGFINVNIDQPPTRGEDGDAPSRGDTAPEQPAP